MSIRIRELGIEDYQEVLALWQESEGVGLSSSDSREQIAKFLARNPGCSLVACEEQVLVGAVLCGHDGRRGYIHHLAVRDSYRRRGVGRRLVNECLRRLKLSGIQKCHLFVFENNVSAIAFWRGIGWTGRDELNMMSRFTAQ